MRSVGRDIVIGLATVYGLDGLGIETRWRRDLPHLSIPALGPTHSNVQLVPPVLGPTHSHVQLVPPVLGPTHSHVQLVPPVLGPTHSHV